MKRYFSSIKQYSWVVLACALLATIIGFLLGRAQPTVYQSTSELVVQAGVPGTTYPGGPPSGVSSAEDLSIALNYTAELQSRSVMQYVIKFDPQLQKLGFTADDLILDVVPSTSSTAATITLLASASHPEHAVLLANDVANGFVSYRQTQSQQHLDALRKSLTTQISTYQGQKMSWEAKLESLPNNTVPQYAVYSNNLQSVTQTLNTLQTQLQALPDTVNGDVAVIQLAGSKDVTTSPKGLIITAVTGGVGLLVGVLIMLLLIFLDSRLRSDEQVKEKLGLAYLGGLSNDNEIKSAPKTPTGAGAHELSDICANLRLTGILPGPWKAPQGAVLLVTSPQVAEGKTTLAVALAATLARSGDTAVVLDGNLQQPSTHLAFGMNPIGLGLSGLLKGTGNESVDDAVLRSNVPGVWLLPAGSRMDDATVTLLLEQKLPGILKQLRKKVDVVIIDGPAILSGADAVLLATMADGVALVIDVRHEKLPLLMRAVDLLKSLAHTSTGLIMNRLSRRKSNPYYAAAFPGNVSDEKWVPVQAHSSNGNESNNGQKLESAVTPQIVRAPSPPSSVQSNVPMSPTSYDMSSPTSYDMSSPIAAYGMPPAPAGGPSSLMQSNVPTSPAPGSISSPTRPSPTPPPAPRVVPPEPAQDLLIMQQPSASSRLAPRRVEMIPPPQSRAGKGG